MNSGSYIIMQVLIIAEFFAKKVVIRLCKLLSKYSIFRRLGIYLYSNESGTIRYAFIKLFIEGYLDLALITFINSVVFIEAQSLQEIATHF
jgi:hypothetical protein